MINDIKLAGFSLRRLPNGGILTIGYCFPYCFLKICGGGQGLDGEGESCDSSPSPPPEKTLTGALSTQSVCPLPLKYYKLKIFKHLTYR